MTQPFHHQAQQPPVLPPWPRDRINQAFYAASRRGGQLLGQALPGRARNPKRCNRVVACLVIGGTAIIFSMAWLLGNWVQAQFPPSSLLTPESCRFL